ncbi:T9SS type A sorting domain-containing protein [Marinilabilia salmonicolor]|uniref:T9SS type A sorting domain-containing protein n=1 Tax=Marinilabilia salmonicolor TaxID=989 RepID=UPI000299FA2A|nr:T9SS type A sorting domain-containing protein [Marinilabilia salmonicolor]
MKHRKVMLSILLLAICISIQAQQLVTATGGNASGSGGTVSYSIGQVVYHSHTGTNGSVLEGIQQPYEISVLTVLEEAEGINLLVLVYPNPTTDFLQLKVESDNLNDLTYQLLNMQGKLLENEQITGNQTSIAMSNLAQGTYFVKIIQGSRVIKTFKVVKTE